MQLVFEILEHLPKSRFFVPIVAHIIRYGNYNQATTKLAFHSNETSKDKLSII